MVTWPLVKIIWSLCTVIHYWRKQAEEGDLSTSQCGKRKSARVPVIPLKGVSTITKPPPTRPCLLNFHLLSIAPDAGDQDFSTWAWRTFKILTMTGRSPAVFAWSPTWLIPFVQQWMSYLTSLNHHFLMYKMVVIVITLKIAIIAKSNSIY